MADDIPKPDLILKKFEPVSQAGAVEQASAEAESPDSVPADSGGEAQDRLDPKEVLSQSVGKLADRMRRTQTGWLAHFGFFHVDERFRELRNACKELQIELLTLSDDPQDLLNFQSKIDDLEATHNRLRFRLIEAPSAIVIAAVSVAIGLAVYHSGLIEYLQDKLELKRVMRYVLMAVAGALLWGLTSIMSRGESAKSADSGHVSFSSILVRVLIAIVVPTIIVMLTFKKDGTPLKLGQMWKSPEIWSFLAGYSCQIIILVLNKLVDKVTKMIESL